MSMEEVRQLISEGVQLLKDGKLDEAIAKLKEAVDLDPSSVQAHAYLGAAYARDGQGPASVEQFQAAVDLDPDNPVHTFNLGQAFEVAGSKPRAMQLYEKALALDPKYSKAQQRLDALTGKNKPSAAPAAPPAAVPAAPAQAAAPTTSIPTVGAPRPAPPPAAPLGGPPQYGAAPAQTQYGAPPTQYGGPPRSNYDPSLGLGRSAPTYSDFSPAWKRLVAALIDGLITAAVIVPMVFMFVLSDAGGVARGADPSTSPGAGLVQMAACLFGLLYYVGFNSTLGATPGKLALGMRILKTDGTKIGVGTAFGRYLLQGIIGSLTCQLAYIVIIVNEEHRGWHDQIMSTMVVDK